MARGYLRFPHLAGDLLTFVAEDDIWLAPLGGGRAWRGILLGAALLAAGNAGPAHEKFERVLTLDPGFPTAREIRTVLARR